MQIKLQVVFRPIHHSDRAVAAETRRNHKWKCAELHHHHRIPNNRWHSWYIGIYCYISLARTYYSATAMTLNQLLFTAAYGINSIHKWRFEFVYYNVHRGHAFENVIRVEHGLIKCIIILQMMELQCFYNYKCSEIMKCQIRIHIHVLYQCIMSQKSNYYFESV